MFMRPEGTAGMKYGSSNDFVIGEIRETKWTIWPLNKLLLLFLDLNEGTHVNVYKRIRIYQKHKPCLWTYIFKKDTNGYAMIKNWKEQINFL